MNQNQKPWALVTGASAGIGAEFCRQLAAQGYSIVLVARRENRLRELAEDLSRQNSIDCRCYPLDLAEAGAAHKLADYLDHESIQISFLVFTEQGNHIFFQGEG